MRRLTVLTALVVVAVCGVVTFAGAATPLQVCAKSKLNVSSSTTSKRLGCYATAAGKGVGVDLGCLGKLETKFLAAFTKADDKGGCVPSGDGASVEAFIDACVDAIRTPLGTSAQKSTCLKMKLAAAGKKAAAKLKCAAKAAARGQLADPTCLAKAHTKFEKAWLKADAKDDCVTSDDVVALEAVVDGDCVGPVVAALPVPTPVPTSTVTPMLTPTRTATPTATPTPHICTDTVPPAWAANVSMQNSTRANALPAPNPALEPFCWKATVATTAQGWADGCSASHNPNLEVLGLGENIYYCASSDSSCPTNALTQSVTRWAAEVASYDYPSNTCSQRCQGGTNNGAACTTASQCPGNGLCSNVCGHYTQLVWRDTIYVGCGVKNCTTGSPFGPSFPNWTIVVCNHDPPGNFIGQQPY
jgi:hypothetical protein